MNIQMTESDRKELFQKFFDHEKIAWQRSGDCMELRIDDGLFICADKAEKYDVFLRQYGFPSMRRNSAMTYYSVGIITLVCRIPLEHFAAKINSMSELSEWERSKFILATKDVHLISGKLLCLPNEAQTTPEINAMLKQAALYRLKKHNQV